jgi:STE24 endopeptidase
MNVFAVLIPLALLAEYGLHLVADLLNLRALRAGLPDEFTDVYDAERYRRSQEYTRARTRFGFVPTTFHLATLFVFWYAGGFQWLDVEVRALELGPVATGLLYMAALGLARTLLGLPFSYYSTFVIEERFGFNKTTVKTFWADAVKGLLLAVVLGGPLLGAILWFFEAAGSTAWLWCWGVVAAFTIVLQYVAPTWIMPLFNKFEPLEEGDLREAVLDYAGKVSFPLEGLFVIDGSRRSTKANAFFTGFGKQRRVALFDTLIEKHSPDELVAIVAHEIGHYKRGHIKKNTALGILQAGLVFFLLSVFLREEGLFAAFLVEEPSIYAGLVFFGLLYTPIDLVLSAAMQAFSRKHEFEADAFARETTGSGERLASALKGLAADSLQNLTPHPLYVKLHYSHPPLLARIEALRSG